MSASMGCSIAGLHFCTSSLEFESPLASAPPRCGDLIHDLKAMQSAQKQLLQSLGQKNQIIATVLDQNAEKLEKIMSHQRTLKRSDLSSLHISAQAFRCQAKRETALIAKFERASDELLGQVQSCLSSPDPIEKLGQR